MRIQLTTLLGLAAICLLISSCQMTQYHSAKTLQKGEKQLILGFDSWNTPVLVKPAYSSAEKQGKVFHSIPFFPQIQYNWGTRKRIDHSLVYAIQNGFSYATKIQVLGNAHSRFAAALRPEIGLQPWAWSFKAVQQQIWARLPLLLSYYPTPTSSITYSPTLTFSTPGYEYHRLFPEAGFQHVIQSHALNYRRGKRNQWILSYGLTRTKDEPISNQFSFGYSFRFGRKK